MRARSPSSCLLEQFYLPLSSFQDRVGGTCVRFSIVTFRFSVLENRLITLDGILYTLNLKFFFQIY